LKNHAPRTRITVEEASLEWLSGYVATVRGVKDRKLAAQRVRDYLIPFLGAFSLSHVSAETLRGYRLWLEKRPLSVQSVRHILSDIRCFLRWCEDRDLIDRSPVPRKLLPKIQERPPDRLTDEEVDSILTVPEPYAFVVRLGLGTGMRWGELRRAHARDVLSEALVVSQTKSGKVRRIPLPPDLLDELRLRVGKLCPFSSEGSFARQVRKASGVARFHVHQLRHTFACRWLERGGSLAALQDILGHSTIVTTQRYGRLSERHVADEVRRLGRSVPKPVPAEEVGST
jgi:integrase